jgi:hypothetical protein
MVAIIGLSRLIGAGHLGATLTELRRAALDRVGNDPGRADQLFENCRRFLVYPNSNRLVGTLQLQFAIVPGFNAVSDANNQAYVQYASNILTRNRIPDPGSPQQILTAYNRLLASRSDYDRHRAALASMLDERARTAGRGDDRAALEHQIAVFTEDRISPTFADVPNDNKIDNQLVVILRLLSWVHLFQCTLPDLARAPEGAIWAGGMLRRSHGEIYFSSEPAGFELSRAGRVPQTRTFRLSLFAKADGAIVEILILWERLTLEIGRGGSKSYTDFVEGRDYIEDASLGGERTVGLIPYFVCQRDQASGNFV